jgi:SRR1
MDDQEWVRVVPKRAIDPKKAAKYRLAGSLQRRDSTVTNHEKSHDDNLTVEDIVKGFSPLLASMKKSDFLKRALMSLEKTAPEGFSMMISLGVGNVLSSQSSLLQFALVLCIRESWQLSVADSALLHVDHSDVSKIIMQDGDISNDLKYQIFDPLFSAKESLVCRNLGLFVSDENRKGKHKAAKGPTLFFMPHCPYRLYVNLLWENWDNLENVIILGNR